MCGDICYADIFGLLCRVHNCKSFARLDEKILSIIDYGHTGSLFFNYDLLGYGFMALSTFFAGFLVNKTEKHGKTLSLMLKIHGIFFPSCFLVPMFPLFNGGDGDTLTGTVLLLVWCAYFLPVCCLGFGYFCNKKS